MTADQAAAMGATGTSKGLPDVVVAGGGPASLPVGIWPGRACGLRCPELGRTWRRRWDSLPVCTAGPVRRPARQVFAEPVGI